MSYLLTQMFLYLLVALALGLLLGWLLWRYGQASTADYGALKSEVDALKRERNDLNTNLEACRNHSAKERETIDALRNDNSNLHTRLGGMAVAGSALPDVSNTAGAPSSSAAGSKPEGLTAPRDGIPDALQAISGIGPKMEELVHGLGYYHFDQIAAWTPSEVAWVDNNLEGFKGRVSRDKWIDQAKRLAKH